MKPRVNFKPWGKISSILNVSRLVAENLLDDPQHFCLQTARRFGKSSHLNGLQRVVESRRIPAKLTGLTALLREDRLAVAEYVNAQGANWADPAKAARLADTAIASQLWDVAERVLDSAPLNRATARSRARLEYSLGNLDEAIAVLVRNGNANSRQLRHYRSELQVLESWNPVVNDQTRDWELNQGTPRVLYVATNSLPFTASGYTQRTHSLLMALQQDGVEVHAVTRVGYPLSIGNIFADPVSQVDGIAYHRMLPARLEFDAAAKLQQQTQLLSELVKELQPTVLHTTTDYTNALSVRAVADAFELPWVYEVRGQLADTWASTRPEKSRLSQRYQLFKEREAEVAASATSVLTLGHAMQKNLEESGVGAKRISVIPNGVGSPYTEGAPEKNKTRADLGLDPQAQYFGTISSLVAYEGLDTLVRILANLTIKWPALRLLVVGDGVEREPLMRLARELEVADKCIFPGRVSRNNAAKYHAAMDVFAVPRKNLVVTQDVTPLKPVEAMAFGVPVLASKLPALEELIQHEENGILVSADDVHAWTEAIEKLLNDQQLRERLGKSARGYVLNSRTWAACSQKLKQIYSQ
ncbi:MULTISPECIES: glycosyltransferase family 4 protein [Glutamicibacter]|uniref:glycosyltransferase family 4 protein n=1 Tax=Glutamicibacter TaxID=1742989 RepID=UPI000EC85F63|nr:glycosyltransferase family 4 protein [Glutamicibacter sp.]HCJ54290.1 glycosyltransferase WbuB [Glutamicibacter sp.]